MKKIFISVILIVGFMIPSYAQNKERTFYNDKLTIEPAVGAGVSAFGGEPDVLLAALAQYNLFPKLSFISHTVISSRIGTTHFKTVEKTHDYTFYKRIGIGTTFYSRKISNSFFLAGGVRYYSFSGTMNNKLLEESVDVESNGWYSDWGLLYNFKWGKKKIFFSSRIYLPLSIEQPAYHITENFTIEFGIGIRIL